ncbi:Hypothetical predicted protein, partial [Paramuricea clavata]
GNKASEVKANFISILENEVEEISQSQDEFQYSSDLHKDSMKTNGPSTNYPTCDSTCSNLKQYLLINDLMSKFMQRIDDKVEGIMQEVNNLKANTSQQERIDLINNLKREIDKLKNKKLRITPKKCDYIVRYGRLAS